MKRLNVMTRLALLHFVLEEMITKICSMPDMHTRMYVITLLALVDFVLEAVITIDLFHA